MRLAWSLSLLAPMCCLALCENYINQEQKPMFYCGLLLNSGVYAACHLGLGPSPIMVRNSTVIEMKIPRYRGRATEGVSWARNAITRAMRIIRTTNISTANGLNFI